MKEDLHLPLMLSSMILVGATHRVEALGSSAIWSSFVQRRRAALRGQMQCSALRASWGTIFDKRSGVVLQSTTARFVVLVSFGGPIKSRLQF